MTNQSINNIEELLEYLTKDSKGYYIEQPTIYSKENIDGHTIYSRYKYFNDKVDNNLLKRHLQKDINLAISLENIDAIVYEYCGVNQDAFYFLLQYYFKQKNFKNIFITTLDNSKMVVYVEVKMKNFDDFNNLVEEIDKNLTKKLDKEWRVLPDFKAPKIGNLLELPRELINF